MKGLSLNRQFAGIQILGEPIAEKLKRNVEISEIIVEPLANIYEKKEDGEGIGDYTVNILAYVAKEKHLEDLALSCSSFSVFKNEQGNNLLAIKYNGLVGVNTWINVENSNNQVYCRDFEIVYDAKEKKNINKFDLYLISFDYTLTKTENINNISAEAIIVRDENLDPDTSRGTISTGKQGDDSYI